MESLERIFSELIRFDCRFFVRYGNKNSEKYFFVEDIKDGRIFGKPVNYEGEGSILVDDLIKEPGVSYSIWINAKEN